MGKGDRKSRRGKLWRGSYGKRRPKVKSPVVKQAEVKTEVKVKAKKKG